MLNRRRMLLTQKKTEVKNLLPWPYSMAVGEHVIEGTTYTIYDDGRIHVGGTPTSYNDFVFYGSNSSKLFAKAIEGKIISIGFINGKEPTENLNYTFTLSVTTVDGTRYTPVAYYGQTNNCMVSENIDISQYGELSSASLTMKRTKEINFDLMLYPMVNEGPNALPFVSPVL